MALPAPVDLPATVLAALAEREGLGELHPTLAPAAVWHDAGNPAADDLPAQLALLGWRTRDGGLDREVASSLAVLCRPGTAYYGWLTHDGTTTAVLAAAIGREGVLAVRRPDGTIRLRGIGTRQLAERLVAQLPDVRPARGTPVTVSLAELRATDRRGRQRARGGVVAQLARPEVRRVRELLALPTTGAGELYASGSARPVCYVDTADGRYMVVMTGPDAVRVGPAHERALVEHLHGIR